MIRRLEQRGIREIREQNVREEKERINVNLSSISKFDEIIQK
jgi:hypothetical protein